MRLLAYFLAAVLGGLIANRCVSAEVEYPIQEVSATTEAGILFNRDGTRRQPGEPRTAPVPPVPPTNTPPAFDPPPGGCPGGVCPAPGTELIPLAGETDSTKATPAAQSAAPAAGENTTSAALTPEQTEALKGVFAKAIEWLIPIFLGAFMGSGNASPFIKMILEKLAGLIDGGAVAPGTTPVRAKRRSVRKAKKAA